MISFAQSLPIGNAVKIVLAPSATAKRWRVLRKLTDNFTGYDDAGAKVVYDGNDDILAMDVDQLTNGTEYFYANYEFNGTVWAKIGNAVSVTPATSYNFLGPDALTLVRNRLKAGIKAAVAAGALKPEPPAPGQPGVVEVFTAPPLWDQIKWPIVSVHLANDASDVRAIGETLFPDTKTEGGDWEESEGWLSRVRLQVIGWSTNPDERIALRKVIKAIIIGNLSVFDAAGMIQVDFSQSDVEDFNSYNSPVYQSIGEFSCLAPAIVDDEQDSIDDVTVEDLTELPPMETH